MTLPRRFIALPQMMSKKTKGTCPRNEYYGKTAEEFNGIFADRKKIDVNSPPLADW